MIKRFNLSEFDVVYISYDEPNAEKNYADLLTKIPWALRVHGVKGSDSAHKAAARLCSTDRFITIDGDNIINPAVLNQTVELDTEQESSTVFSWPSKNIINGLQYGNGGIKCWPRQLVLDMQTHENADSSNLNSQIDFCWENNWVLLDACYATIENNASPLQAWRGGFREGVKLSLNNGIRVSSLTELHPINLTRLQVWLTLGRDVPNGIWAILGARQGSYLTTCTDWDFKQVRDFDYLNSYWKDNNEHLTEDQAVEECNRIGKLLDSLLGKIEVFSPEQSEFFKVSKINPKRQRLDVRNYSNQYDIVMITYDEKNAEENWANLVRRFPFAKRLHGVSGIHNAHRAAASLVNTNMFWVVDGDAEIVPDFDFKHVPDTNETVTVWKSLNPVNGLTYGYGGVKLLPTKLTLEMDTNKTDMTTSISRSFRLVDKVSNITAFNTDAFSAWRSGFREACKLASKCIDRQSDKETAARLDVWCTTGIDKPFGVDTINGAIAGMKYGEQNKNNAAALSQINNFNWLLDYYRQITLCR